MALSLLSSFFTTLLLVIVLHLAVQLWKFFLSVWWKPRRINRILKAQDIGGPPYRFFYGNLPEYLAINKHARSAPLPHLSHDIAHRVIPHVSIWSKAYGKRFVYWFGYVPRLTIPDPDQVKEIVYNRSGHFPKMKGRSDTRDLTGNGLASLEGEKWAQHRRIISPAFFMEKLKAMAPTMAACTQTMLDKWQHEIEENGEKEIDVHKEFRTLTGDVIAHTAFGSSYAEGKRVFELQHELVELLEKISRIPYFPGLRFLPTAINRHRWSLSKRLQKSLINIIQSRIECSKRARADMFGTDLLGLMMAANKKELQGNQKNLNMGIDEIMDECKTFFFAGHETTSTLLTWTLMILSESREWQGRARAEVVAVCGKSKPPEGDSLAQLKIVGMVLNESLRLYPPAVAVFRQTVEDMKLSNGLVIPEGVSVVVPILVMHHDEKFWGKDSHEFKPERFGEGVANACKHPMAFLPFSVGPRNCVGQNFAMMEAKVVLSMILQRFAFRLSPSYQHAPSIKITLQPEYGMPIIFERLS